MTYIPAVTANVSVANSTIVPLGAGATFIGTPDDVSQYSTLSISYRVQPPTATGNIIVQFSNTNSIVNWIPISNTVTGVTAMTANGFTLDSTMTLQYFRVIYVNDSTIQTSLTISSIYHPQARIATKTSRFAETINDYTDSISTRSAIWGKTLGGGVYEAVASNGNNSLVISHVEPLTSYGDVPVAQNHPVIQLDFCYGINTVISSNIVAGSNATITATNSLLNLSTNSASGSSWAVFTPKKYVKYRPGQGTLMRWTAMFANAGPANSIQFSGGGFLEPTSNIMMDGAGFGYDGSTFGIFWYRNYTKTFIPQTAWNLDTCQGTGNSGIILDPTKINVFQLKFQYLGGGDVFFYVMSAFTGRWVEVHIIRNAGSSVNTLFNNPTLRNMWYANNYSGTTQTLSLSGGSCVSFVEGVRQFLGPKGALSNVAIVVNGVQTLIFALKNATYFNGSPNRSQIRIRNISFAGGGDGGGHASLNGTITLTLVRNPTTGSPLAFTPYNGSNASAIVTGSNIFGQSTLSSNTSSITEISGGNTGFTQIISFGSETMIDMTKYDIVLYPNDVLCFLVTPVTTASSYIGATVFWIEDI